MQSISEADIGRYLTTSIIDLYVPKRQSPGLTVSGTNFGEAAADIEAIAESTGLEESSIDAVSAGQC